ncbi:hypothetical protein VNI00_004143 [Paramarasmius palmivorus]|uniref:Cytochrome P450 n=1 Tax=Paramarasmius palmivorus TaxID=297713 RepID=A0AAW0DNX5_9AGAR
MAISAPLEYLLVAALLCLSSLLLVQRRNVRWLPLPPGPKPLPLIGNLLDVPASFEWVTFAEWSREYNSDIIHYRVFGTSTIVLNSQRACHDLLEKKSNIYSSRPRWVMLNEVIGWGWAFTTMPYGKEWNARRKLFAHEFSPKQTERYQPHSLKAVRTFLLDLLSQPHNSQRLLRHMAGSAILSITYGLSIRSADVGDSVIDMAERALESFVTAAVPGTFWVDYLPVLKYIPSWFPGASFKRKAREWAKDVDEMLNMPFDIVKSNLTKGIVRPCFVSHCLSNINTLDPDEIVYNEKVAREAAGAMYEAGTDTTVVASITFILMMICHPEIQRKGQEELDRVVGQDRLPTFDDKENLPYVYAIINEVMRYQPVNPAALAHLVSEEDEYNGYRIPKDSVVIGNAWWTFFSIIGRPSS